MKRLFCTLVALLVWEAQAACNVNLKIPANRQGLICGQAGRLNPANAEQQFIRQIYQPSVLQCASVCRYNSGCKSFSYAAKTGECRHFETDMTKFVADKASTRVFSDPACYRRPTTCPVLNGNFEMPGVVGKAVVPKPNPAVFVTPWETSTGDQFSLTSTLRRFSNQQLGNAAQHTPDGNFFGIVTINGDDSFVFQQILSLKPNTNYRLSFIYNLLAFQGQTGTKYNNYVLNAGYGPRAFLDKKYFSGTLDPDDTSSLGIWNSAEFDFTTTSNGEGGVFFGVTATPFYADKGNRGLVGFDAIQVAELL